MDVLPSKSSEMMQASISIDEAKNKYVERVGSSRRSPHTVRAYGTAMRVFFAMLKWKGIDVNTTGIEALSEDEVANFISFLNQSKKNHTSGDGRKSGRKRGNQGLGKGKTYQTATAKLYLGVVSQFYKFLVAENIRTVNLPRIQMLIRMRGSKSYPQKPQPPREIVEIVETIMLLGSPPTESLLEQLRTLRDRALIVTLADTGLRIHEACKLKCADLDLNEGKAMIIGKGNQQAIVRFSSRSIKAIRDYLQEREALDKESQQAMHTLPVFSEHRGRKITSITTATGRTIVARRVKEAVDAINETRDSDNKILPYVVEKITPHTFRHHFVTTVLRQKGNLKIAQVMARHKSITSTQIYAHVDDVELDKEYYDTFG